MKIVVVDCEVFSYDWIVVFKDVETGEFAKFHNDGRGLTRYMNSQTAIYAMFNGKHYDQFILRAIRCGASQEIIKDMNDFIIKSGRQGWEHYFIRQTRDWFPMFDLMDDMQMGLSLKAIEGHMGMDIEESDVPFDLPRPLTSDEIESVTTYCTHDVNAAERLLRLRRDYLAAKIYLGGLRGIPPVKSLYMTNAKITSAFLNAVPKQHCDEDGYQFPPNLRKDLIPKQLLEFSFLEIRDFEIAPDVIVTYGSGGVHQALKSYVEVSDE